MATQARAGLSRVRADLTIVLAIGALAIWLPPRPPMIDLPQFAGQIALLKSVLTGSTPWAANLRIDVLTPYLIGYALTLPLAFVLPITVALKAVLTAAMAAFGLMAAAIRRELGASRELDAFATIGFFGSNYAWGLVTFLIAAPLGLLVVWLSLRYSRNPTWQRGVLLVIGELVLLWAHALVFLLAVGVGSLLILARVRAWGIRSTLTRTWPNAGLLACGGLIYLLDVSRPGGGAGFGFDLDPPIPHVLGLLFGIDERPSGWTIGALAALAALPFLGGLRLRHHPPEPLIIAAAIFGAIAIAPVKAWLAAGLYMRFALFAPAAWAWLFSDSEEPLQGLAHAIRSNLALAASALTGLILFQHVVQAKQFARETGNFESVMAMARPGQRALGLVLDKESAADLDPRVYWHFPLWYEAEKGGLVDPNFAAGAPAIVRYVQNPPGLSDDPAFPERPERFDWRRDHGEQWTYFFVRAHRVPTDLFAGANCPPVEVVARGAWALFEKRTCEAANP